MWIDTDYSNARDNLVPLDPQSFLGGFERASP